MNAGSADGRHPTPPGVLVRLGAFIGVAGLAVSACSGVSGPAGGSAAKVGPGAADSSSASGEMSVTVPGGRYTSVLPARLSEVLRAKDFVLVNVHVPYEGEIDGTDLFIPFDVVANQLGKLPPLKDARIVVYCRTGRMSTLAATTLVGLGYTNVWELDGGMVAWEAAGHPLVQRPGS